VVKCFFFIRPGVDFTKHFCQEKVAGKQLLTKNLTLNFTNIIHTTSTKFHSLKIELFAKYWSPFAKGCSKFSGQFVCQEKLLILFARKSHEHMLMKSTPGLNLINVLGSRFSYESAFFAKA
jgi:hypothetical protein